MILALFLFVVSGVIVVSSVVVSVVAVIVVALPPHRPPWGGENYWEAINKVTFKKRKRASLCAVEDCKLWRA